jgi:hypothetical protein
MAGESWDIVLLRLCIGLEVWDMTGRWSSALAAMDWRMSGRGNRNRIAGFVFARRSAKRRRPFPIGGATGLSVQKT